MNDLSSEYWLEFYRTNVSIFFSIASETIEGAEKLAGLNLQAGRTILAESAAYVREIWPDAAASEAAVVAINPAVSTASNTSEAVRKSVREVLETAQANASMAVRDVASESGEQA